MVLQCRHCGASLDGLPADAGICPQCGRRFRPSSSGQSPVRLGSRLLRRYADDVILTDDGQPVPAGEADAARSVPVPHRSSDVLLRVGPYEVLGELGRGGMAVVYRAWSVPLGRSCALKVVSLGGQASDLDVLRFRNEALLSAHLNHPNIVRIHDAGEADGRVYIAMDLIEGRRLVDAVAGGTDADLRRGVAALAKVARAVHYAHGKGIVHRDLKPDNILVDAAGEPHVTDFGLAKHVDGDSRLTTAGQPLGTPVYMPPEQANGEVARIGPLSDVYSLGATLYHVLTGRPPFTGRSALSVAMDVLGREPDRPRHAARAQLGRDLPEALEAVCLKAMEKEADRRYPSALALAEDLEAWLEHRPVKARSARVGRRLERFARNNRRVLAGGTLVAAILALMIGVFGTMIVFDVEHSSTTLRAMGRDAAVEQAQTLERSIRSAMLQGTPQVARDLVAGLRRSPGLHDLDVLRPDRTLAYPQAGGPAVPSADRFRLPDRDWEVLLADARPVTRIDTDPADPTLTIYTPLANGAECRGCHVVGGPAPAGPVIAILAVRRSLRGVEDAVGEHRFTTLVVGAFASGAFLVLLYLLARLFGIGLRPAVFGSGTLRGPVLEPPVRSDLRAPGEKNS